MEQQRNLSLADGFLVLVFDLLNAKQYWNQISKSMLDIEDIFRGKIKKKQNQIKIYSDDL